MAKEVASWFLNHTKIQHQLSKKLLSKLLTKFQLQLQLWAHAFALTKLKNFKDWSHQKKLFLTHFNLHALALIHALTQALTLIMIKKMLTNKPEMIKDKLQVQDLAIDSTPKTQVLIPKTQIMNGIKDKLQA